MKHRKKRGKTTENQKSTSQTTQKTTQSQTGHQPQHTSGRGGKRPGRGGKHAGWDTGTHGKSMPGINYGSTDADGTRRLPKNH